MSETCADCRWSRRAAPRADLGAPMPSLGPAPPLIERIRCNRFPQEVENDATYWCGEYLATRFE